LLKQQTNEDDYLKLKTHHTTDGCRVHSSSHIIGTYPTGNRRKE